MLTRVARTATTVLSHTFYVDETPTNSSTTPLVTITDANGTVVVNAVNATHPGDAGLYTYPLPAQPQLQLLTVAWSATIAGAAVIETDQVEVVGGFLFGLAEGRAADPALTDSIKFTPARLVAARLETEQECEEICDRAFVPRYKRLLLDGTGTDTLVLPSHDIRTIRAVRVATAAGGSFVALTSTELAALAVGSDSTLVRPGGVEWTEGRDNVLVEYEHGLDAPPMDLKRAALRRFRWWCQVTKSTVPDRATSYTGQDGTTYRLDQPGPYKTGFPDIDAVYGRYSLRSTGDGEDGGRKVPASRTLTFDVERSSMFHGHGMLR